MTTEVRFPVVSTDEPDAVGVVGTWFVLHGEAVAAGQVIAEVQVDKVSQDVAAPVAGTMYQLVAERTEVRQGEPIARID